MESAKEAGFKSLELSAKKVADYLDAGFTESDLKTLLKGLTISGMGYLVNIERQGLEREDLITDARKIFSLAQKSGAKGVQVLSGPLDVNAVISHSEQKQFNGYKGLLGLEIDEIIEKTAQNLSILADVAQEYGLVIYLEALAWTPLKRLEDQIKTIQLANKNNIKIIIDFWHLNTCGNTPEDVKKLDKNLIYGVHVCDGLENSSAIPEEVRLRNVDLGQGVIQLDKWIEAVKATGYEGWWASESFYKKEHQDSPLENAQKHYKYLETLILN
ncbi:sugar phosphate isomerase/epimerase family protein [Acinetobacter baumannii]|uniref:sugar phosphate isomerase/epimerase family protein n=1 Tax=Acinetobacter baumannii TaxID=470 RepID=UPI0035CF2496